MPKFRQIKKFDAILIPNVVFKVRPYLYCTKKQIEDPDGLVMIKVDIWMYLGEENSSSGWQKKRIKTHFYPRCEVDIDQKQICRKNGDIVEAINVDNVIDVIRRFVFSQDESSI